MAPDSIDEEFAEYLKFQNAMNWPALTKQQFIDVLRVASGGGRLGRFTLALDDHGIVASFRGKTVRLYEGAVA